MVREDRQFLANNLLDLPEFAVFGWVHQRYGNSVATVAACPADTVNIALRFIGEVEIDDVGNTWNVYTACRNVCGNENAYRTCAKAVQRLLAGVLRLVAVDNGRLVSVPGQITRHPVGSVLGAREYDYRGHGRVFQHARENMSLLTSSGQHDALFDFGRCRTLGCDLYSYGLPQQALGQVRYLLWHCGREQRRLAFRCRCSGYAPHVVDEAHVEHAICFVQHEPARLGEFYGPFPHEIGQAAGSGHQNVDARLHLPDLAVARNAAEHERGGNVSALCKQLHGFLDLNGELARRSKDESPCRLRRAPGSQGYDARQDRQGKSGSLAGAGLRDAQNVTAGELRQNGLFLDRLGFDKAGCVGSLQQLASDTQRGEAGWPRENFLCQSFLLSSGRNIRTRSRRGAT